MFLSKSYKNKTYKAKSYKAKSYKDLRKALADQGYREQLYTEAGLS